MWSCTLEDLSERQPQCFLSEIGLVMSASWAHAGMGDQGGMVGCRWAEGVHWGALLYQSDVFS